MRGVQEEMRCNNRALPCRAGHYYGYVKVSVEKYVDDNSLKNQYLITSSHTAFAVDYLWDITLQILFSRATFEGLANIFNNLHFIKLPFDIMQKRENIIYKRIAEAFFLYAFIEVGQRFQISVIIPRTLGEHSKFKKNLVKNLVTNIKFLT